MDLDAVHVASAPNEDITTAEPVVELTNIDPLESISSSVDTVQVLGTVGEVLTKVELALACFSEKLVNLNVLTMHVSTRENDFEAFVSDKEHAMGDYDVKAMEFDLLSGILDSEVRELDTFMSTIHSEIINVRETVSSCKNLEQASKDMEDKLNDSEESLKQSLDQLSEIRVQSAKFQKILSSIGGENNSKLPRFIYLLFN